MRKLLSIALITAMIVSMTPMMMINMGISDDGVVFAETIPIDEEHFPDANFRNYLTEKYGSSFNPTSITKLVVNARSIESLEGIQYFTALEILNFEGNSISSLDLSHNTVLEELRCTRNELSSLDLSYNTALKILYCDDTNLSSLDLSHNTALERLRCNKTNLSNLDLSHNTALEELNCGENNLGNLDVSYNTALVHLYCHNNSISSLDVSQNIALEVLYCDNNKLSNLDVSHNTALWQLHCYNNNIGKIYVLKNNNIIFDYDDGVEIIYGSPDSQEDDSQEEKTVSSTGFSLHRDNNSYEHAYHGKDWTDPGISGFYGVEDYDIDAPYMKRLIANNFGAGVANIITSKRVPEGWCYGIATTIAGVFNKDISLSDISSSGAGNYYDMAYPCNDRRLLNAINYYHLAQTQLPEGAFLATLDNEDYDELTGYAHKKQTDISTFFTKMKNMLDAGKIVILGYPGHAILVTGYDESDAGYVFTLYDENSVNSTLRDGKYTELEVSANMDAFVLHIWGEDPITDSNYGRLDIIDPAKVIKEFPIPSETEQIAAKYLVDDNPLTLNVRMAIDFGCKVFTHGIEILVMNKSPKETATFIGQAKIKKIIKMFSDLQEDDVETYALTMDPIYAEEELTIKDIEGDLDIVLSSGKGAIYVNGDNIEEVKVKLGSSLEITGTDYSVNTTISCYDKGESTSLKLVDVNYSSTGTTRITADSDGVSITGESTITDLNVENFEGMPGIQTAENATVEAGETVDFSESSHSEHNWDDGKITKEPTCIESGVKTYTCNICGKTRTETVPAIGHQWNTTYTIDVPATESAAGSQSIHCAVCGTIKEGSSQVIPQLTSSTSTVTPTAPAEITDLPTVKISKPTAGKKKITVKWKKVSKKNQKKIAKIQIQYSLDKKFKKGVKTVTAKKTATSKIIKKLKSKKTYYVRIRAYKKSGGKVHVSKWSTVKKVKVK